jgi:hypothetical protein
VVHAAGVARRGPHVEQRHGRVVLAHGGVVLVRGGAVGRTRRGARLRAALASGADARRAGDPPGDVHHPVARGADGLARGARRADGRAARRRRLALVVPPRARLPPRGHPARSAVRAPHPACGHDRPRSPPRILAHVVTEVRELAGLPGRSAELAPCSCNKTSSGRCATLLRLPRRRRRLCDENASVAARSVCDVSSSMARSQAGAARATRDRGGLLASLLGRDRRWRSGRRGGRRGPRWCGRGARSTREREGRQGGEKRESHGCDATPGLGGRAPASVGRGPRLARGSRLLAATQEAVAIRRRLAARNADAFPPISP